MITGLPPNCPPITQMVRCLCNEVYFVFMGSSDAEAQIWGRAANLIGVRFVDARIEPFMLCECGEVLGFSPEGSAMVQ